MADFQSWTTVKRSDIIPQCPSCCKNDNVGFIDAVLASSSYSTGSNPNNTTPVWHCSACDKVFGQRTGTADSTIFNNSSVNNGTILNGSSVSISAQIDPEAVANAIRSYNHNLNQALKEKIDEELNLRLDDMNEKFIQMNTRLQKAEELAADPLLELRRRVAAFELR